MLTDIVKKIFSSIQYSFNISLPLNQLEEIIYENKLNYEAFYQFAKSVLENEPINRDHIEWKILSLRTDNIQRAIDEKIATIKDISSNGIREPVEIFYDDGGPFYYHGYHRLGVAKYLNLEIIPVKIHLCSQNLLTIANTLFNIYQEDKKHYLYQPLTIHPFSLLPLFNPNISNKTNAIAFHLHKDIPFVDFGAHLGYVTRNLHLMGFHGIAIESNTSLLDLQPILEKFGYVHIDYDKCNSVEKYMTDNNTFCSGIFCSFLHHYFKSRRTELEEVVVPWMQKNCIQAFVEHDFNYENTNKEEQLSYWESKEFIARPIFVELDGLKRTIFKLTNKALPHRASWDEWEKKNESN